MNINNNNGFDMFEIMDPKDTFFNRLSLNTQTCVSKDDKGIGDPKDTFFNKLSLNTQTCVSKDDKGIGAVYNNKNNNGNNDNFKINIKDNKDKLIFNQIVRNEISLLSDADRKEVFSLMNNIIFITSLSLSDLYNNDNKLNRGIEGNYKNVIASTSFFMLDLSIDYIVEELSSRYLECEDIYIINVSWLDSITDNLGTRKYECKNVYGIGFKLFYITMGFRAFFNQINNISLCRSEVEKNNKLYLGLNPIIIFRGLHWGNIVYLFELQNIKLHGGSITNRHKLSIAEYRLGWFLNLINLCGYSKDKYYQAYRENLFSGSRYDVEYKKSVSNYDNPFIKEFKKINKNIYYVERIKQFDKDIQSTNNLILNINREISSIESSINYINNNNLGIDNNIAYLKNKNTNNTSNRNKINVGARIKKFILLKEENQIKLTKFYLEINKLRVKLNLGVEALNKLEIDKNKFINEGKSNKENSYLLNIKDPNNNNITTNNGKDPNGDNVKDPNGLSKNNKVNGVGQIREYHSLNINTFQFKLKLRYKNSHLNLCGNEYSINKRFISTTNYNKDPSQLFINSPVYLELQRLLNTSKLDTNCQIKIERFLINQGSILLKEKLNQELDINYAKLNPEIFEPIRDSIIDLNKLINNYRDNLKGTKVKEGELKYQFLLGLSNEIIISKLLGRLLRIITNNQLINSNNTSLDVARDLGISLLYSFYNNHLNKNKKYKASDVKSKNFSLKNYIEENSEEFNKYDNEVFFISLGIDLFYLLVEINLIEIQTITISKDNKTNIYVPNKIKFENLEKSNNYLNLSHKIPMIVKPKKYSMNWDTGKEVLGGYLLNDKEFVNNLIISNPELKDQSKILRDNSIFDMVNKISSVGYKINIQVLDFILDNSLDFYIILDPNYKHPLFIKKEKGNKLTKLEKTTLDSFLSRRQLEMNILGLALIFKNVPQFYIPVRIDNRGRTYCMVDYLHYQSIELAKSLLLFSKGEMIYKSDTKSIDYLKIFGANCYGNGIDKKTYVDRVEWVNKNEFNILNFKNGILLREADSKLLFIAFCFEYINYKNSLNNNLTYFISYFPIQLDATCNGYQHLSLLTGDEPLAGQLNLIADDINTVPKDFYTYVGLKFKDYLKQIILEIENSGKDLDSLESYKKLLNMDIQRKLIKIPIMVKPYNASLYQMVEYIKKEFEGDYEKLTLNKENIEVNKDLVNTITKKGEEIIETEIRTPLWPAPRAKAKDN